jgi:hypothetical protein
MKSLLCGGFLFLVAALFLLGCGDGYKPKDGVTVTGKVVKGGKPLDVPHRDVGLGSVEVLLVPAGNATGATQESSLAKEDGSVRMEGPGRGITPGKYKLAVLQHDKGPGSDMLKGAFSPDKTPITVEIPEARLGKTHDLGVIDLHKPSK